MEIDVIMASIVILTHAEMEQSAKKVRIGLFVNVGDTLAPFVQMTLTNARIQTLAAMAAHA